MTGLHRKVRHRGAGLMARSVLYLGLLAGAFGAGVLVMGWWGRVAGHGGWARRWMALGSGLAWGLLGQEPLCAAEDNPAQQVRSAVAEISDAELDRRIDARLDEAMKRFETPTAQPAPPADQLDRRIDARINEALKRFEGRFPAPVSGPESDKSIEARIQRAVENLQVPLAARRGRWYGNSFALGAAFFGLDAHTHSLDGRLYLHDMPMGGDRSTALPKSAALDFIQPAAMPVGMWEFYPLAMLPQEWFADWVKDHLSHNLSVTALMGVPVVEVQILGIDFPLSLTGELATIRFLPIAVPFTYHIMPQHMIDPFVTIIPIWAFTYHERVEGRAYLGDNTKPDKVRIHFNNPWTVALGFGADINMSDRFFFKFLYAWIPRIRIHANIQGVNLLGTGIGAQARIKHLKIDGGFYGIATGLRF